MLVFLSFVLLVLLFYILVEDGFHLQLPFWVFPCLFILWSVLAISHLGWFNWLINGAINTLLLAGSMGLVGWYARWRMGGFFNTAFGWGDLWFLLAFAWGYPPPLFIALWTVGTLVALLLAKFLKQNKVPYAGYLALCNAVVLASDLLWPEKKLLYSVFP